MDWFFSLFSFDPIAPGSDPETELESSIPVDLDGGAGGACIIA